MSHFLPELPLTVQLSLQDLSSVLRVVGLLLQTLNLPLHGVQRGQTCHRQLLYSLKAGLRVEDKYSFFFASSSLKTSYGVLLCSILE